MAHLYKKKGALEGRIGQFGRRVDFGPMNIQMQIRKKGCHQSSITHGYYCAAKPRRLNKVFFFVGKNVPLYPKSSLTILDKIFLNISSSFCLLFESNFDIDEVRPRHVLCILASIIFL